MKCHVPPVDKLVTRRRGIYKGSPEEMTGTKGSGIVASQRVVLNGLLFGQKLAALLKICARC